MTENGGQHTTNRNFCLFLFVFPYCCFSSLSPGYSICCVVLCLVCLFRERLRRFGRCRPSSSVLGACQCLDFYFFSLSPHIQHTAEEEEEKVMDNEARAPLVFLCYTIPFTSALFYTRWRWTQLSSTSVTPLLFFFPPVSTSLPLLLHFNYISLIWLTKAIFSGGMRMTKFWDYKK